MRYEDGEVVIEVVGEAERSEVDRRAGEVVRVDLVGRQQVREAQQG